MVNEIKELEEKAKSSLGIILPFDIESRKRVLSLLPVAIELIRRNHPEHDVAIAVYRDIVAVRPKKATRVVKAPVTLYNNIHNLSFYVYDGGSKLWVNVKSDYWLLPLLKEEGIITTLVRFEMETIDSWGGLYAECGGNYYKFKIFKNDEVIAEGEASYNACIPGHDANYAYTEIKMLKEPILVSTPKHDILLQP
jgi:hypothetical protein